MTHHATRILPALALLAGLAGCAAQAPFELPDLDTPTSASTQPTPQGSYPAYRYGYRPYGAYGAYGYSRYGNSNHPRNPGDTSGTAPAPSPAPVPAPVAVVPEQAPPRPRNIERVPPERPARTTKAAEDTRPVRREQEQ